VYVLDEPTTGLHFEDIRKLLLVLQGLVDKGNTVIVIEHNLDVVKSADWIIDMGPEGGSGGGLVVTEGTPEQVAADPDSYTGQFLAPVLSGHPPVAVGEPSPQPETAPPAPRAKKSARKATGVGTARSGDKARTSEAASSARAASSGRRTTSRTKSTAPTRKSA
jgi:excinuclease ABC subunit A